MLPFQLGGAIHFYALIIFFPVGFITNILSLLVMTLKQNRQLSTCVYMSFIAVNDNIVLIVAADAWYRRQIDPNQITVWICKSKTYILHLFGTFGAYEIVLMTLDKVIAIKFPLKAKFLCTAKRAKILSVSNFLLFSIFHLPNLSFSNLVGNSKQCARYVADGWHVTAYMFLSTVTASFVPVISLFVMNIIIIRVVVQRGKQRSKNTSRNSERQITTMLLLVSMMFVILLVPFETREIYYNLSGIPNSPDEFAIFSFLFWFTIELFNLNYSINFFLYLLSGSKFRKDLKNLMCGKKYQEDNKSESRSRPEMSKETEDNVQETFDTITERF